MGSNPTATAPLTSAFAVVHGHRRWPVPARRTCRSRLAAAVVPEAEQATMRGSAGELPPARPRALVLRRTAEARAEATRVSVVDEKAGAGGLHMRTCGPRHECMTIWANVRVRPFVR